MYDVKYLVLGPDFIICAIFILRLYMKIHEDYYSKNYNPGDLNIEKIEKIRDNYILNQKIKEFLRDT